MGCEPAHMALQGILNSPTGIFEKGYFLTQQTDIHSSTPMAIFILRKAMWCKLYRVQRCLVSESICIKKGPELKHCNMQLM